MSNILKEPYEISVWQDYYEDGALKEKKVLVIGTDTMTMQSRAIEPKLITNVNGTNTLTFTMYFKYQDTETGEEVENPFIPYLTNETKVKLRYRGKWYDFVVKNVVESSDKKAFSYTLNDLYINELSKTGFDITLATELENNVGSVVELAQTALEGTDWVVGTSETIVQENKEILFTLKTNTSITATPLTKGNSGVTPGASATIPSGATIYGFYSCCSAREKRFQFIYMNGADIQVDSERVILNGQQYYIDNVQYSNNTAYSVGIPNFCNNNPVLDNYRGAKFVFTQVSKKDRLLDRIVKKYTKDNETYWGYVDTQYVSPNIITDYVSNGSEIKTTSGWRAGFLGEDASVKPDLDAVTFPSIPDLISHGEPLTDPDPTKKIIYTPYLKLGFKGSNGVIVNSGFTDSKRLVKDIALGEKFVCYFYIGEVQENQEDQKYIAPTTPTSIIVAEYNYNVQTAAYDIPNDSSYLTFTSFIPEEDEQHQQTGYYYAYANSTKQISEAALKALATKIGIFIQYAGTKTLYVKDFKLFRYYDKGDGTPILPSEQSVEAKIINTYYYYKDYPTSVTSADEIEYDKQDAPDSSYIPAYTTNCEKQKIVNVSQSNRFNIIHTLCESFECWASFEINHDENGAIVPFVEGQDYGKRIVFRNYVGQENPIDLRYGVNVKSIQRTLDSKQLTTKLIVKANSNQYAPNGMCTIARAAANPTGETTIFNFDYYINQGLLDAGELEKDLYLESSPYMGYYVKLARINKDMRAFSEQLATLQIPLAKARAEVQEYEAGALGAEEKFETIDATLTKGYGIGYSGIINSSPSSDIYIRMKGDPVQGIPADEKLVNYVVEAAQYYQAAIDYNAKLGDARATLDRYEAKQQSLQNDLLDRITQKQTLNTNFFKKYSRFIQEGTWTSESYTDENLYFYDAQAVSYESSVPSVTYSISIIDVSPLEGYEFYKYQLGDRTYIQDTEFFGYTEIDGVKTPAREGIVVTELTYNFDQPENNTFKVQTYKNQFQDLFQRVGATVQQLKLSTGAYNRAAALAEADVAHKVEYLQGALNDAATVLMNNADQTVIWDNTGITITNNLDRSQILRLVSGGLLLSTDGGQSWQLGITAEGISANKITSGQVDTSLIQIMNGSEAYFRWDAFGITAFDFNNPEKSEYINGLNTSKGVRFDRFGIYSFSEIDGANWHPQNISQIREYSIFDLTNEGLHINLGKGNFLKYGKQDIPDNREDHSSESFLGRTNGLIYNKWNGQTPSWDDNSDYISFVKVMSISVEDDNNETIEKFALYDDGTLIAREALLEGGLIGGFTIKQNSLSFGSSSSYGALLINTSNTNTYPSLINSGENSPKAIQTGRPAFWNANTTYHIGDYVTYQDSTKGRYHVAYCYNPDEHGSTNENPEYHSEVWRDMDDNYPGSFMTLFDGSVYCEGLKIGTKRDSFIIDSNQSRSWIHSNISSPTNYGIIAFYQLSQLSAQTFLSNKRFSITVNRTGSLTPNHLTVFEAGGAWFESRGYYNSAYKNLAIGIQNNPFIDSDLNLSLDFLYNDDAQKSLGDLSDVISDRTYYRTCRKGYIRTTSDSVKLYGTWRSESAIINDSDRSLKNSISTLSSKYSNLFDNLIPVSYRYNEGTSGRLHTGFIAQDVLTAIQQSGLSTQDFAAYIESNNGYGLRYEEFIALNTWQIQLLKPRVSTLEARCKELEERVKQLEARLNENQ